VSSGRREREGHHSSCVEGHHSSLKGSCGNSQKEEQDHEEEQLPYDEVMNNTQHNCSLSNLAHQSLKNTKRRRCYKNQHKIERPRK